MNSSSFNFIKFFILVLLVSPLISLAATTKLSYSAWIPYWKKTGGVAETITNLNKLNEISPFSYTVSAKGELVDTLKIGSEPWPNLFKLARAQKVKILPAILWTDSLAIDQVLRDPVKRQAHVKNILAEVDKNNFDGIDIDYENKFASTSPNFSVFLRDLGTKLHAKGKVLSCTIEGRTPPESRYLTVPKVVEYANDYPSINKYCDQVRLMIYDQGTVDIKLNMARRLGGVYYPIADPTWVRKVLELALKDISAKKIVLGVATYGYELEITDKGKYFDYKKIRSLSYKDFTQLAKDLKMLPRRNNAGELSLIYRTKEGKVNFVSFSDAQAVADKIFIAKLYNLRGVAIFKIDGESDNYWVSLK